MSDEKNSIEQQKRQPETPKEILSETRSIDASNQQQIQKPTSQSAAEATSDEGPFEEIDLRDPPEEPTFEFISHKDAPHSSYNSQPDHVWKYNSPVEEPFSANKPEFKPTRTKAELEALEELERKKREDR